MPKKSKELSALSVAKIKKTGRHSVGGVDGLCLNVEGNSRVWILRAVVGKRLDKDGKLNEAEPITAKLATLGLGASLQETVIADPETIKAAESSAVSATQESGTLRVLLGINAIMFVVEMTAGLIAQSTGLIADSLDMFADAAVYGLALYAVGRSAKMQVRAAHLAGVLQLILAIGVLVEVVRRFVFGSEPESLMMMAIAFVALIANTSCLLLISKHREGGAHMKASWIFSANDVVINLGVITAGALVAWTGSNYPDLIIGTIVGVIVLNGARRILALKG
ncbi:cation transporter [Acinetobacter bereziniae]|uniref:cation transporter n=1 Tax=Acinetobacter bereziniae TaxID=106648 RepID=UPI0026832D22|nr:cation transporter [Acinetobacter bereziniae]